MPRILSPAYFHHYNAQPLQAYVERGIAGSSSLNPVDGPERPKGVKRKENDGEQLVLGMGPVQNSFWRLSRLVPFGVVRKQLDRFKGRSNELGDSSSVADSGITLTLEDVEAGPQSLEIQENSDGISLTPLPNMDKGSPDDTKTNHMPGKGSSKNGDSRQWRRVPYLPSYVPFGQVDVSLYIFFSGLSVPTLYDVTFELE